MRHFREQFRAENLNRPGGRTLDLRLRRTGRPCRVLTRGLLAIVCAILCATFPLALFSADFLPNAAAHIGTIFINNNDQFTTNSSVTLSLSAVNNGTGVSQMQFSNDNLTWSAPEPFQTTKLWQLINDGVYPPQMNTVLRTVYVRFRDGAGNWTPAVSDSIVFARTPIDVPPLVELWIMQQEPANYDPTQPPGSQRNPGIVPPPPNEAQVDQALNTLMNTYGNYRAQALTPTNSIPVPTNTSVLTLHFGPGIYETHGDNELLRTNSYWNLQTGWRIIGAGKDLTTLRQVGLRNDWTYRSDVIGGPVGQSACYDNVEISDMTLDANLREGGGNVSGRYACGINFVGNNTQVRRVRVKNFGSYIGGVEPAGIRMQNFGSYYGTYNLVVEDCDVVQPQFGLAYKTPMIAVSGEYTGTNLTYYYNVVVRNCYVNGASYNGDTALNLTLYPVTERGSHGLAVSGAYASTLEGNFVLNCVEGYYVDEAAINDLSVRNNHFRGIIYGAVVGFGTVPGGQTRRVFDVFRFENNLVEFDPHLYTAGDIYGSTGPRFSFQTTGDLKGPDDYISNDLVVSNNVFQFNDQLKPDTNVVGYPCSLQAFRTAEVRDNKFLGLPSNRPLTWDNAPAYLGSQVDIVNLARSIPLLCSNNLREDGTVLEAYPFVLDASLPRPVVVAGQEISFPAPMFAAGPAKMVIGLPTTNVFDASGAFRWNTTPADVGQYVVSFYDSPKRVHDPRRTLITVQPISPLNTAQYFANGLVAFWKFEETSGILLYDSSGNSNTMNAYVSTTSGLLSLGAPGVVPTKKALRFVGGTTPIAPPFCDTVLNGFPELFHPLTGGPANMYQDYTVSFWFNAAAKPTTPQLLMNHSLGMVCSLVPGTNASPNAAAISVTSLDQQLNLQTPANITVGAWHHVVITYGAFTSKLYVDSVQVAENDLVPLMVIWTSELALGGGSALANFGGSFAELGIWNRALSSLEITRLYSDQSTGVDPSITPLAPSVLLAQSAGANSVTLTWQDNSMNESGFTIERSTDGTNFTTVASLPANTTAYTDTVPQSGPAYYYRVEATNIFARSDPSNVAMIGQKQPLAPTGLRLINTTVTP